MLNAHFALRTSFVRLVIVAGTLLLTACASTGGGDKGLALAADSPIACPLDTKPTCVEYLGKPIRCHCMDRAEFDYLLQDMFGR